MATVKYTVAEFGRNTKVFTWTPLTNANVDGNAISAEYADYADRCVHILGTFDSATVVWQGGNDGTNYLTLTDPSSTAISKTAAGIEQVLEGALYQKPSTSGGGASQSLTVIAVCRRVQRPL